MGAIILRIHLDKVADGGVRRGTIKKNQAAPKVRRQAGSARSFPVQAAEAMLRSNMTKGYVQALKAMLDLDDNGVVELEYDGVVLEVRVKEEN